MGLFTLHNSCFSCSLDFSSFNLILNLVFLFLGLTVRKLTCANPTLVSGVERFSNPSFTRRRSRRSWDRSASRLLWLGQGGFPPPQLVGSSRQTSSSLGIIIIIIIIIIHFQKQFSWRVTRFYIETIFIFNSQKYNFVQKEKKKMTIL